MSKKMELNNKNITHKFRIVMVASLGMPPYVGGIENVVDTLVNSGLDEEYDITTYDTFRLHDPNRSNFARVLYVMKLFWDYRKFLQRKKPNLVHIHFCSNTDFWKHAICLMVSKLGNVNTVFHLHGGNFEKSFAGYNYIVQFLIKQIFKLPDLVIALSQYWADFLATSLKVKKIRVVFNPIDCDKLSRREDISNFRFDNHIVLLGRVGLHKGHYDVLKALEIVKKTYQDVEVSFAGNDEEFGDTDKLRHIAKMLGLTTNIKFLGAVVGDNKIKLLHESTIMILPSYGENMPLSIMEGMAAKLPVIATDVGAIPEMLENGELGMLTEVGNPQNLAKCIVELLSDPAQRSKFADKAYKKATDSYDIKKIEKNISSLYHDLLVVTVPQRS